MAKNHKMAQGTGSAGVGKAAKPAVQDIAAQLDLKPGQSIELLKALHILTRDGKLNQDSRRKLKQVYHLYQFIEPILQELGQGGQPLGHLGAADATGQDRELADASPGTG